MDHWILSAPNPARELGQRMCLQTFQVFHCFISVPQGGNKKVQYNGWLGFDGRDDDVDDDVIHIKSFVPFERTKSKSWF